MSSAAASTVVPALIPVGLPLIFKLLITVTVSPSASTLPTESLTPFGRRAGAGSLERPRGALSRRPVATAIAGRMTRTRPSAASSAPAAPQRIDVMLGERSQPVQIGSGARRLLAGIVRDLGARRAAVVSAQPVEAALEPGIPAPQLSVRDGEAHKTLATVEWLCGEFAAFGAVAGLTRLCKNRPVGIGLALDDNHVKRAAP